MTCAPHSQPTGFRWARGILRRASLARGPGKEGRGGLSGAGSCQPESVAKTLAEYSARMCAAGYTRRHGYPARAPSRAPRRRPARARSFLARIKRPRLVAAWPRRGQAEPEARPPLVRCDADALIGKLLEARNTTKRDKKVSLTENEVRGLCQAARDIIINQPVRRRARIGPPSPRAPPAGVGTRRATSRAIAGAPRARGAD